MPTRLWRNEFVVNTTQPGNQDQSAITALADGGFVIAWRDDGPADSVIRWQRYDAQGLKAGPEFNQASFNNPGADQSAPAITQLANGRLWLAHQDFDTAADRDVDGFTVTLDGSVSTLQSAIVTGDNEVDPSIASLGAAGSVAVWVNQTLNGGDIHMRGFNAAGAITFGAAIGGAVVNDNVAGSQAAAQVAPVVAATKDGSKFIVAWQDDGLNSGDIRARVFDAGGNALFPEFTVNGATLDAQQAPSVAWLDNNRFVAVWHAFGQAGDNSSIGIRFAIKAADGSFISSDNLVNTTTHDTQSTPMLATLPNGGFVVAWRDASLAEPDTTAAIRLQAFDTNGNRTGGEILVNTTTNSDQFEPAIAALADGRVVVSWTDPSTAAGGNGTSIRAQIVDPRDGLVTGTSAADTLYGHDAVGDEIRGFDGIDLAFGLNGNDTIYGGAGDDTLDGGRGDDSLYGGLGIDILFGGVGDDEFFGEDGNDNMRGGGGEDSYDGGIGTDTVDYGGSKISVTAALDGSLANTNDAFGDTYLSVENLKGANLAGAGDTLVGDGLNNALTGNAGDDSLRGKSGNDQLVGGAGIDTLRGDLGDDQLIYNATTELGDIVLDFSASVVGNNDLFRFKGTAFAALTAGTYSTANFVIRAADNLAQDSNDFFIYRTSDTTLWFDANGSSAGAPVMIANLQAGATMTFLDIAIF